MINIDNDILVLSRKSGTKNGKKVVRENFTSRGGSNSLSPNVQINYDKMCIEFETKNIDNINITTETIYINSKKYKDFTNKELGTFLLEIMNNYDTYMEMIYKYLNMLYEAKADWRNKSKIIKNKQKSSYINERKQLDIKLNNTCTSILRLLLYKLLQMNPKLFIVENYIGEYVQNFYSIGLPNTINNLKNDIENCQKKLAKFQEKRIDNSYCPYDNDREHIVREKLNRSTLILKRKDNISYIFNNITKFFSKLANEFRRGKELIDNSFIYTEKSRNKKFSAIPSTLPNAKIEYKIDDLTPKPFRYSYEISTIEELFYTTIYQLSLNHQVIIKCKNCGKYFIPRFKIDKKTGKPRRLRNDNLYCDKNCLSSYIEDKRKKSNETETDGYDYYRKLYKRYKDNPTYSQVFEELQTIYYNQYRTKQIDDKTFMKMLIDFEENVNTTHNVKRGRPKKNKNA